MHLEELLHIMNCRILSKYTHVTVRHKLDIPGKVELLIYREREREGGVCVGGGGGVINHRIHPHSMSIDNSGMWVVMIHATIYNSRTKIYQCIYLMQFLSLRRSVNDKLRWH